MRVQRIVLEHHGDVALGGFEFIDHALANLHFALGDFFQSRHHAQQSRLAAARRTHDDHELAVMHAGVNAVQHGYRMCALAVAFDESSKLDACHG